MNKKREITIVAVISVAVIIIIASALLFAYMPIGSSNRKEINVKSYVGNGNIIIPVKMIKGVYTPHRNGFNSDKSLEELCKLYADKVGAKGKYTVMDNAALLFDEDKNYIQAQLVRFTAEDNKFDYMLHDGSAQLKGYELIVPFYLTVTPDIEFDGSLSLRDDVTFDDVKRYYNMFGEYIQVIDSDDSVITLTGKALDNRTLKINFAKYINVIRYNWL